MSRCFPFPPPGYEGKIKAEVPDLLKKEKHREKKHKKDKDKEKKGKEKNESKEKHEKERTDEKRGEKKDKKEKHRDKKKDKERDLDKDKNKGDGLVPAEKAVGPPDVALHKLSEKSKDRKSDGNVTLGEKRVAGPSVFNNEEPLSKNNNLAYQTKIVGNAAGLGRRITDEERRNGDQLPERNFSAERKKDAVVKISSTDAVPVVVSKEKNKEKPAIDKKMEVQGVIGEGKFSSNVLGQNAVGAVKLPGGTSGPLVDGRERREKQAIGGRMDEQTVSGDTRSSGCALPPNFVGMAQNRVGAAARSVEKKLEHKLEEKEKVREKEGDRKGGKRKEEDREKSVNKDKEKEKKEKKKVKATSEQKHVQVPSKIDGSENHMLTPSAKIENKDLPGPLTSGLQKMPSSQGGATLLEKRKDMGLNGIYDERMTGPNKLARTTASTHPLTENGRSLEPCQDSAAFAAGMQRPPMNIKVERTFAPDDTQRPPMNIKVDGKERKVNDTTTGPLTQSSQATAKVERKPKVSAKPSHPDTKYLSQVLSVPKLDDWPEFDDQEWLLSSDRFQTRKPQVETSEVEETHDVWASALWLESVDVFALPYVIPH